MEDVQATVLEALAAKAECRAQITDDLSKLSIDSLAMAELALEIEQRLKIRLDDEVLDQTTVLDLVRYVQKLVDKQRPKSPANP
jgi:acyl carrier protein